MAVFLLQTVLAVGIQSTKRQATSPWGSVSMQRYRLKAAIPAILDKPGGDKISVTLPVGAVLGDSTEPPTALLGMIAVSWEGRHYSVYLIDLLQNACSPLMF